MDDFAIIGGGIVGLATGLALQAHYPDSKLVILEKESEVAHHQTGNNSGVVHSGIYYWPGSLKARLCTAGSKSLKEFCDLHGVQYGACGKVIVATEQTEIPRLYQLYERGLANGLEVRQLAGDQIKDYEPHARGLAGLWVPSTAVVNYKEVSRAIEKQIIANGGRLQLNAEVLSVRFHGGYYSLETKQGICEARFVINCAGLFSDRVAKMFGVDPKSKIVPFRGEYFELKSDRRHLVNHLIYPVPNPAFPFLGVHLTRMIDESVHAGPNAVLGFKREGYRASDFDLGDMLDALAYPGFWRLAAKYGSEGIKEIIRSKLKSAFTASVRRLVPAIQAEDLIPSSSGVRAMALARDGELVDDFLILHGPRSIHVCNAPSPAATSSLEIGKVIVSKIPEL